MRLMLMGAFCLAVLAGCASRQPANPEGGGRGHGPTTAPPASPTTIPIQAVTGKVVLVNAPLRYVVVDFALGRPPVADQRMSVYRKGQKVGEVRISSQSRNNNFAADIMVGNAGVGDEVREH